MSAKTLLNSLFGYKASADDELLDALSALGEEARSPRAGAAKRGLCASWPPISETRTVGMSTTTRA